MPSWSVYCCSHWFRAGSQTQKSYRGRKKQQQTRAVLVMSELQSPATKVNIDWSEMFIFKMIVIWLYQCFNVRTVVIFITIISIPVKITLHFETYDLWSIVVWFPLDVGFLLDAWESREGRLLAYELIMKFFIKNHWLYTFGPAASSQLRRQNTDSEM